MRKGDWKRLNGLLAVAAMVAKKGGHDDACDAFCDAGIYAGEFYEQVYKAEKEAKRALKGGAPNGQ